MPSNIPKELQWWDWNRTHPPAAGATFHLPMWAGMGATAFDPVGGHDGAITGATWGSGNNGPIISCANTSGLPTDYVSADSIGLGATESAFTAIIRANNDLNEPKGFIGSRSGGVGIAFGIANGTSMRYIEYGVIQQDSAAIPSTIGTIHDYGYVIDSGSISFYLDGVLVSTHAGGSAAVSTGAGPWGIGAFWDGNDARFEIGIRGHLEVATIYNRALTPGEIAELAADPFILSRMPSSLAIQTAATLAGGVVRPRINSSLAGTSPLFGGLVS